MNLPWSPELVSFLADRQVDPLHGPLRCPECLDVMVPTSQGFCCPGGHSRMLDVPVGWEIPQEKQGGAGSKTEFSWPRVLISAGVITLVFILSVLFTIIISQPIVNAIVLVEGLAIVGYLLWVRKDLKGGNNA